MKPEVTAEKSPACVPPKNVSSVEAGIWKNRTKMSVVLRSSSYFFLKVFVGVFGLLLVFCVKLGSRV